MAHGSTVSNAKKEKRAILASLKPAAAISFQILFPCKRENSAVAIDHLIHLDHASAAQKTNSNPSAKYMITFPVRV
jgi:hypothetical protein